MSFYLLNKHNTYLRDANTGKRKNPNHAMSIYGFVLSQVRFTILLVQV